MKRSNRLVMTVVVILTMAVGCNRVKESPPMLMPTEAPAVTEAPALTETPAITEVPLESQNVSEAPVATETPVVTEEPAATSEPEITKKPFAVDWNRVTQAPETKTSYEDIIGSWYLYSYEVDGSMGLAADDRENCCVTFNADRTATIERACYTMDGEKYNTYKYSGPVSDMPEDDWWGSWHAEFGVKDCEYYYSIDDKGNLVERCDILYDGGLAHAASHNIFTRKQQIYEGGKQPEIPADIRAIMDGAQENQWISVILGNDNDRKASLDEAGFPVHDIREDEYYSTPVEAPCELVVCNTSDRTVEIVIAGPAAGYDTKTSDTEWDKGYTIYANYLMPGEIARYIVDVPMTAIEAKGAKMAMYMYFDGDEYPYWMRIFDYCFNYLIFQ